MLIWRRNDRGTSRSIAGAPVAVLAVLALQCCTPAPKAADAGAGENRVPAAHVLTHERVATFEVANDGAAGGARVVSFGQVFRQGAVLANAELEVTLDGMAAPCQMNPKAFYPDGSVRHAVIAVQAPAMGRGAVRHGTISTTGRSSSKPVEAPHQAPPNLTVTLRVAQGPERGAVWTFDLPTIARTRSGPTQPPWLSGPLVHEQRYYGPIKSGVQVVFDVWTPSVGPGRVDVVVHNDTAQTADISTRAYGVDMILDGRSVFHLDELDQYAHSTWHEVITTDGQPPLRIIPDTHLLRAVGAVPNYADIRPDPALEAKLRQAAAESRPLGFGGVTPYMPTTGGRADIGPLPTWAVAYLLDPSRENQQTLFIAADAAGSVPWHVRDQTTDGPIDIDKHPDVWLDGRGQAAPPLINRKFYVSDTKWQPDDAHEPSLTYLPYLLTGSQYYRDELAMQAGYVLASINPAYRKGSAGLVLGSQVRAVAWDLRTLATAAYILPTRSALQPYFQSKLEGNLQEIRRRYVEGRQLAGAGELEGYMPGPYAVEAATPPWQDDYLTMVLGWIDGMGFHNARPIMGWMTNFVAGLFTNGQRGYDPIYGTPYILFVKIPRSDQLITTWAQAFQVTFDPVHKPVRTLDNPDWGGGYAALARGALASIINSTDSPQARAAYTFVKANTPRMEETYAKDPTFAIVPKADTR